MRRKINYTFILLADSHVIHLALILLAASSVLAKDHEYCALDSCPNRTHTLCKYSQTGAGAGCGMAIHLGLDGGEIQTILNLYNINKPSIKLNPPKDRFAPESSRAQSINDYKMEWDEELAAIAQRWANQCKNKTDECRNIDRFRVRQQVGVVRRGRRQQRPSIYPLVSEWHFKDRFRNLNLLGNPSSSNHYTNSIQQNANKVGCGAVRSIDNRFQYLYFVCNFGPTSV